MNKYITILLLAFSGSAFAEGAIDKLRNEPVSMFDLAMFRLQNDFFMNQEYDEALFRRQYKGIEFSLDIAFFWSSRELVKIHRNIQAKASLANCTLAIETLRSRLTLGGSNDSFIRKYFWHYKEELPPELREMEKSIYLVGEVFDLNNSSFFYCESRLDEEEVKILKKRPAYD
jgi:hypothetical protein